MNKPKEPKGKPSHNLEDFDFTESRIFGRGYEEREIRLHNKKVKPLKVNFRKMSPGQIEDEIKRALKHGCNYDKIEALKADYHVWNMVQERMRGAALVMVADQTQTIEVQSDGSLLNESNLAQIDYELAKCEPLPEIAARFGVDVSVIKMRELTEQQNIIDLRRRLNAELEDSSIGLAHDFVRMEELQETLEIVKAHIIEYEDLRVRTDLDAEERLTRMATLPNIISLLNTKEKLISSAQKQMQARRDAAETVVNFDLTEEEEQTFERLHKKFPILELIVARSSVDNGWDTAYMLAKLGGSIYKEFRRGEHDDDHEIKKLKDMTLPYPSEQPVNIEEVVTQTEGRDNDRKLMTDRDKDVSEDKKTEMEKKKQALLDKIKKKANGSKGKDNS